MASSPRPSVAPPAASHTAPRDNAPRDNAPRDNAPQDTTPLGTTPTPTPTHTATTDTGSSESAPPRGTALQSDTDPPATTRGPRPLAGERKRRGEQFALYAFVIVPFLALAAAIPVAWGWGLGWRDIVLSAVFYAVTGLGITAGFHRYFTHGSFKARRGLHIALGIAGSLAIEGPVTRWVADHRRHHAFSDREGDPHSPWRYGDTVGALLKGLGYAHIGWMFDVEQTNQRRFAPDLLDDRDMRWVNRHFPLWVAVSMGAPALLGGLWAWSWTGAVSAFFWATLVRICVLHHVTWSINSICHTIGERPFAARDRSANFWPLAILSFGESWHNSHHADPTAARHGVLRGQIDLAARLIALFEWFGWARDVRWPSRDRILSRLTVADQKHRVS